MPDVLCVVGPRWNGWSKYHYAYGTFVPTLCNRPVPQVGWREVPDEESNKSMGHCDRCLSKLVGAANVSTHT